MKLWTFWLRKKKEREFMNAVERILKAIEGIKKDFDRYEARVVAVEDRSQRAEAAAAIAKGEASTLREQFNKAQAKIEELSVVITTLEAAAAALEALDERGGDDVGGSMEGLTR